MTTTDERYNGWTNRETWAVALYINNDQGWQESVFEALRGVEITGGNGEYNPASREAGEIIKANVERLLDPDQYADEFGTDQPREVARIAHEIGSLWRVNWDELGASFLADLAEIES